MNKIKIILSIILLGIALSTGIVNASEVSGDLNNGASVVVPKSSSMSGSASSGNKKSSGSTGNTQNGNVVIPPQITAGDTVTPPQEQNQVIEDSPVETDGLIGTTTENVIESSDFVEEDIIPSDMATNNGQTAAVFGLGNSTILWILSIILIVIILGIFFWGKYKRE